MEFSFSFYARSPEMHLCPTKHFANIFVTVEDDFTSQCRCREGVTLFGFALSPYSLAVLTIGILSE
jgi:hypothetical protein